MELTIHVDPVGRTVRFREVHALAAGDSCSVVLEGVRGADAAALRLALYRDAASDSPVASCPSFAPVQGHPNLATGDLRLDTAEMAAWFEAVRPEPEGPAADRDGPASGDAAERAVRTDGWLVVSEPTRTWAACRVPVVLRPGAGVSGVVDPTSIQSLVEGLVSAAMSEALAAKADLVDGKVPAAQLPSYVDDVLEYDAVYAFPRTGEGGKIYVAKGTNKTYRWGGAQYVELSQPPELDDTVTEPSSNGVKSSGVWSWVKSLLPSWLTSDYAEPATVESVEGKADKATTLAGYGITDAVPLVKDAYGKNTAVTIGSRSDGKRVGGHSLANGIYVSAQGDDSHAEGASTSASGTGSHAEGVSTSASGDGSHAEGESTFASGNYSHAEGICSQTREGDNYAFAWNGDRLLSQYLSHGPGTFNINPAGGPDGFYLGEQTLPAVISSATANKADKATTLAGYGITDGATKASLAPEYSPLSAYSVGAVVYHDGNIHQCKTAIPEGGEAWNAEHWELRKLEDFFTEANGSLTSTIEEKSIPEFSSSSTYEVGEIVIYDGVAYKCVTAITTVEEWTAAHWTLATNSDIAARLKGLRSDGTATDAFATSLLGKPIAKEAIDEEIIEKGTAPDAHLEAPTDEHLKIILADNSVAYDSAKALPYKLTSVIGDRVIATMTLTAASTDITLPAIAANDTTVKDFILDVTNAYAVDGVETDAGINIPRTDFKLVTRDGESLTAVTTVKAGKSAFICFTQKSPVVVDGTTYPCWCVIQLPFGDPS